MSTFTVNRVAAFVLLLVLCGCMLGPDFKSPAPPAVDHYNATGDPTKTIKAAGVEQHFNSNADVPADWWQMFGSADLNKMMTDAFAANPTVQAAEATLRVSQDNLRAGNGVFYPQANASGGAIREKFLPQQIGESGAGNIFNLFTLSGAITYALDIFGGERRNVEALGAQVDYQQANLRAAYLTLSGNLVNAVIARAAYNAEIDDLQKIIDVEKQQVHFTETEYHAGIIPYANVLSLRTQLSASEAALPVLQQSLTSTENLLTQLSGQPPAVGVPAPIALSALKLPVELPVTVPSKLVHKRPDIIASEAQLHNASAEIGVATAAMFPSLTLSSSYGVSNTDSGKLFTAASGLWGVGADLAAPIFRGGTLSAERQAAKDTYDQALANYHQTVLASFAQVANTLRALEHDAEALEAQSDGLSAAEKNLQLVRVNYQAGLVNYVQVLIVNTQYLQAEMNYTQNVAQRLQDTVALYVAMGGGWEDKK